MKGLNEESGLILYFENPQQNLFKKISKIIILFLNMSISIFVRIQFFMKKKFIFRGIYWIRWCHTGHCYWKTEYSKRFWIVNAHVNVNLIQIIYRASYFALGKMKIGRNFFSSTLWLTFYNFLRHKRDFFVLNSKVLCGMTQKITGLKIIQYIQIVL